MFTDNTGNPYVGGIPAAGTYASQDAATGANIMSATAGNVAQAPSTLNIVTPKGPSSMDFAAAQKVISEEIASTGVLSIKTARGLSDQTGLSMTDINSIAEGNIVGGTGNEVSTIGTQDVVITGGTQDVV